MKRTFFVLIAVLLLGAVGLAQYTNPAKIVGTNHDLSATGGAVKADNGFSQVCFFCHTPHQKFETTDPNVLAAPQAATPLWNKYLSTTTYNVYQSASLPVAPTNLTLTTSGFNAAAESNLCLSCHDGTVGVNTLFKGSFAPTGRTSPSVNGSGANNMYLISTVSPDVVIGTDSTYGFQQEHPVNFDYTAALAVNPTGLATVKTASNGWNYLTGTDGNALPLFGKTMQCGTCHNVHSNGTARPFLRSSTASSGLCIGCHNGTGL